MMIRSQDKFKLVPFNRPLVIFQGAIFYNEEISESDGFLLGIYDSTDRCIEILDEIQSKYNTYISSRGGESLMVGGGVFQPFAFTPPKVYEMPEK